jgi:hypothetical protein
MGEKLWWVAWGDVFFGLYEGCFQSGKKNKAILYIEDPFFLIFLPKHVSREH